MHFVFKCWKMNDCVDNHWGIKQELFYFRDILLREIKLIIFKNIHNCNHIVVFFFWKHIINHRFHNCIRKSNTCVFLIKMLFFVCFWFVLNNNIYVNKRKNTNCFTKFIICFVFFDVIWWKASETDDFPVKCVKW